MNNAEQAFYEAMLARDKRDEQLRNMPLYLQVQHSQALPVPPVDPSALPAFADLPSAPRRRAGKPAESLAEVAPPDNAALARMVADLRQEVESLRVEVQQLRTKVDPPKWHESYRR